VAGLADIASRHPLGVPPLAGSFADTEGSTKMIHAIGVIVSVVIVAAVSSGVIFRKHLQKMDVFNIIVGAMTLILILASLYMSREQLEFAENSLKSESFEEITAQLDTNENSSVGTISSLEHLARKDEAIRTRTVTILALHLQARGSELDPWSRRQALASIRGITTLGAPPDSYYKFDLSNYNLHGQPMSNMRAEGAYFHGTNFQGVNLSNSSWVCVDATEASLVGVVLEGATIRSSRLNRVVLSVDGDPSGSSIERVDVSGADFSSMSPEQFQEISWDEVYWTEDPTWPAGVAELPAKAGESSDFDARVNLSSCFESRSDL
jgi:uncharacterized protein YjbI with pentapeptide repeats